MKNTFTAVLIKDKDFWIGWIKEYPGVNCQEPTREELIDTLKITLQEALEINEEQSIEIAGANYEEELIEV